VKNDSTFKKQKCEQNRHFFNLPPHNSGLNLILIIYDNHSSIDVKRKLDGRIASLVALNTTLCKYSTISHLIQSSMLGWIVIWHFEKCKQWLYFFILNHGFALRKQMENECKLNQFVFPFHHNPFNNLLRNKIPTYLHIKLFIQHMLIWFQRVGIPSYQTHKCNWGLPLANIFPQRI
jgi:hypothetical protein